MGRGKCLNLSGQEESERGLLFPKNNGKKDTVVHRYWSTRDEIPNVIFKN